MAGVTVREARDTELDDVADLLDEAYRQYFPAAYGSDEERDAWEGYRAEIRDTRRRAAVAAQLVADAEGDLLGAVSYYPPGMMHYDEGELAAPENWSGIRLLGVAPAARGRRIGRMLTEACIDRARADRAAGIMLHTTVLMEIARGLYERMGFQRAPELDFSPIEDSDFVVMGYRLPFE